MSVDADLTRISIVRAQLTGENFIAGLELAAADIVNLATQLAPEDTGALKESGESHREGNRVIISFGNGLGDDRAIAQEYGTVYMPAQPYLTPAIKAIDILFHVRKSLGLI